DTPTGELVLTTRTHPTIGSDGAATLTITDNDAFPVRLSSGEFQLLSPTAIANEKSGLAPIVVLRTDGTFGAASVLVSFTAGTARAGQDFNAAPVLVQFANGELSKTIFVPLRNDLINEPAQTFTVTL